MKEITSLQNPLVKRICELHSTKGRKKHDLYIAEGIRTVKTIIESGKNPKYLFYTEQTLHQLKGLKIENKFLFLAKEHVFAKISTTKSPNGILAVFDIPKVNSDLTQGTVLTQISDPGNMGTIIRTTAAIGHKTVVVVEGCDPYSPKAVQASVGTIAKVNIHQMDWNTLLECKKDLKLCAMVVKGGKAPNELNFENSLIVVGSEAHGLPQIWIDSCEQKLTLPMPGNTESLNAAVAGSIAIYLSK